MVRLVGFQNNAVYSLSEFSMSQVNSAYLDEIRHNLRRNTPLDIDLPGASAPPYTSCHNSMENINIKQFSPAARVEYTVPPPVVDTKSNTVVVCSTSGTQTTNKKRKDHSACAIPSVQANVPVTSLTNQARTNAILYPHKVPVDPNTNIYPRVS